MNRFDVSMSFRILVLLILPTAVFVEHVRAFDDAGREGKQSTVARIASPYDVATRSQLFADKLLVRDTKAVSFTLHQGKKHPQNPLVVADKPWEGWRLEIFGSVIYDEDEQVYKMWYIGESPEDFPNYATLYATSLDGVTWEKPLVATVDSARGTKTNAVAIGYILASVMKDDADLDASQRYKMICWKQEPPYGAHLMVSPDGLSWRQVSTDPICPSADVVTGFYDERRKIYVAFPKINATVGDFERRCFGIITSPDFRNWTTPELVLTPDARDDAGALARIEQVRPILDQPDDPKLMKTEFYGMGGNYTHGTPVLFHETDPESGAPSGRKSKFTSSIGMVSWPVDRFVSVDAGAEGGTLTTVPIVHQGDKLVINARTAPEGSIVIELLDAAGHSLDESEQSQSFAGDELRHEVRWPGDASVSSTKGQPISLRFHLRDAELFSFAFRAADQVADIRSIDYPSSP